MMTICALDEHQRSMLVFLYEHGHWTELPDDSTARDLCDELQAKGYLFGPFLTDTYDLVRYSLTKKGREFAMTELALNGMVIDFTEF